MLGLRLVKIVDFRNLGLTYILETFSEKLNPLSVRTKLVSRPYFTKFFRNKAVQNLY